MSQLCELEWSDRSPRIPPWRASVSLIMPDGREIRFLPAESRGPSDAYRLNLTTPQNQLIPGAEYGLLIVDDANVITGKTTLPKAQPFSGLVPISTLSHGSDTVRLSWPRVPGAAAYHVAVQNRGGFEQPYYSTFTDTSIVLAGSMRTLENEPVFEVGGSATIIVSAVDDNFYTYYHAAVDPFAGAPPSRLSRGLGVFGSIVPILVRGVTVRP